MLPMESRQMLMLLGADLLVQHLHWEPLH